MWADIATAATDVAVVNAPIATADAAVSTTAFLPAAQAETPFVAARVSAPRYAEDSAVAAAGVRVEVAVVVPAITPSTRNRHCSGRCPRCSTATEVSPRLWRCGGVAPAIAAARVVGKYGGGYHIQGHSKACFRA